jgi:hypothetical protein
MARTKCDLCGHGVILEFKEGGISNIAYCPKCQLNVRWSYVNSKEEK